ncbi:MAG: tail fiber domain-containing protein [Bacteroidota bacterium]|nr:tail fiber domain-containing protein [Bacteroidota bacterium]
MFSIKKSLIIFFFLACTTTFAQNIGINSNGATPNSAAMLDIDVNALTSKKGLLIPRMTLVQLAAMNPLPAPAQGLMIYQTDGQQGFYYNTSTTTTPNWVFLLSSSGPTSGWMLAGNMGTNPGTDFIGTTDAADLVIKAQNTEIMRITTSGKVGINESNPTSSLQVRTYINGVIAAPYDGVKLTSPYHSNIYNSGAMFGIDDATTSGIMGTNAQLWNFESGFLRFGTDDIERMRLTSTGRLGLHETNPLTTLTIRPYYDGVGGDIDGIQIIHPALAPTYNSGLLLGVDNTSMGANAYLMNYQNGPLSFGTNGNERMRITENGHVAIGTTNSSAAALAPLVIYDNSGVTNGMMVLNPMIAPNNPGMHFGLDLSNPIHGRVWNYMNGDIEFGTNNAELMRLSNNGNIGIGTTNPTYKLEVNGSGKFSSLTIGNYILPTFDGGGGQVLQTNGMGTVSWATPSASGTVSSVGITMPSVFSVSNSPITSSGDINVSLATQSANQVFAGPSGGVAAAPAFRALVTADIPDLSSGYIKNQAVGNNFVTGQVASFDITGNGEINGTLNVNGNVGIGTLTPAEKLEVVGKTKTTTLQVTTGATNGYILTSDASGNATWQTPSANSWSLTGNSGTTAGTNFIGTTDPIDVVLKRNNDEAMRLTAGGAILITGNTTTGVTPTSGSGKRMMWIPAKGAFRAGSAVSTEWDDANIGNGSIAMGPETKASGYASVAIGERNWATGGNSTALGWSSQATGAVSFALGVNTLASGYGALTFGYQTSSSGQGSIAIGTNSTASADSSIVIGAHSFATGYKSIAIGNSVSTNSFSGSMVLGDNSTTTLTNATAINQLLTRFSGGNIFYTDAALSASKAIVFDNGNVGIGNISPTAKLEVAGQIKITGGTPGLNKVLMSDASGLASWQIQGTGSQWLLTGNSGTTAGTNYIGTSDAVDVVVKTNAVEAVRVTSAGNIGINTSTPISKLEIVDNAVPNGIRRQAINALIYSLPGSPLNDTVTGLRITGMNGNGNGSSRGIGVDATGSVIGNGISIGVKGTAVNPGSGLKIGVYGTSGNSGYGVYAEGNTGVYSNVRASGTGDSYGFYTHINAAAVPSVSSYGVYALANSFSTANYGIYAMASNGGTNWAGYFVGNEFVSGNLGIANALPTEKLDVTGNVKFSGALMPNNSAGTANQVLTSAGPGLPPTWATISTGLSGGTTNYLPKWSSATSLSSTSLVYDNGTNVGINTTTPPAKFTVLGTASNPSIPNTTSTAVFRVGVGAFEGLDMGKMGSGSYAAWLQSGYNGIAEALVLQPSGGNTGIGLTAPVNKLDVEGATVIGATYSGANVAPLNGLLVEGNVGIGCTAPSAKLTVVGNINATGTITASLGTACSSDKRFKKNISPLNNALTSVLKLDGVSYNWRVQEFPERDFNDSLQIGFIAQEVEKIYPQMVFTDAEGYKSVDYSRLTPVLVEAIKEQQKIIDEQAKETEELKSLLQSLTNRVSAMEVNASAQVKK